MLLLFLTICCTSIRTSYASIYLVGWFVFCSRLPAVPNVQWFCSCLVTASAFSSPSLTRRTWPGLFALLLSFPNIFRFLGIACGFLSHVCPFVCPWWMSVHLAVCSPACLSVCLPSDPEVCLTSLLFAILFNWHFAVVSIHVLFHSFQPRLLCFIPFENCL